MNSSSKQLVAGKKIGVIHTDEEPSAYLRAQMRQADENYKKGKTSPVFKTGEEAVVWLEKQGI